MTEEEIATFRLLCATLSFKELLCSQVLPADLAMLCGSSLPAPRDLGVFSVLCELPDSYLSLTVATRLQRGLTVPFAAVHVELHARTLHRLRGFLNEQASASIFSGQLLSYYTMGKTT